MKWKFAFIPAAFVVGAFTGIYSARDLRFHELESSVFGNTRTLRVLVPSGYDAPANHSRRYPVLYLNDGQNLFDSATAVLNRMEWRVDEIVDSLIRRGDIPPIIVVGIDNAGRRDRFKEYFPYYDEHLQPPEPNPQGKRYPEFLIEEVIPFIESRYRVAAGAGNRVLGGSSAGGLAAIYTAVARPGAFGGLLIESPSIYIDDYHILREAAGVSLWPDRIYLGVGSNEYGQAACDPVAADTTELVRDVRRFERVLRDARINERRIKVLVVPCAVHNELAWANRLPAALTFLFGGKR